MFRGLVHYFSYFAVRIFLYPFGFLPQFYLHGTATVVAYIIYYCYPNFRKRSLSNLALATALNLTHKERKKIAIKALQNVFVTFLEFAKLDRNGASTKSLEKSNHLLTFKAENISPILPYYRQKKGMIFFAGHQGNWELALLKISQSYPSLCIVKKQKNPHFNKWLTNVRAKYNVEIVEPRGVLKGCVAALEQGKAVIICGDQAVPQSPYSRIFLGRRAYMTTLPALLAYKTNTPILMAAIARDGYNHIVTLSDPILPDTTRPKPDEVNRMMEELLSFFEKSILKNPDQWLWVHNFWKQEAIQFTYKEFRYESILIILPMPDKMDLTEQLEVIAHFRKIYPRSFIDVFASKEFAKECNSDVSFLTYETETDLFIKDDRYKLLFNLSDAKIERHFLKQSVFKVFSKEQLLQLAIQRGLTAENPTTKEILTFALVQPNYWDKLSSSKANAEKPTILVNSEESSIHSRLALHTKAQSGF